MTEKVNACRLLDSGLNNKLQMLANPHLNTMSYEYDRTLRVVEKMQTSCFQEKLLNFKLLIVRTENEHTWSGINVPRLAS